MPSFIVDTQLPPKLAAYLSAKGFNSIHTSDLPNGILLKDIEIIELAINQNRIIITKDSDFLDYFILKGVPPKVFIIQLGNISNKHLFSFFDQNLLTVIEKFEENHLVIMNQSSIIAY